MTTLTFDFPIYPQLTEEDLASKSLIELFELWDQNDQNLKDLHSHYNEHFCTSPEYDRDYLKAKLPLETTDNNLYIIINRFVAEEARRERAERERLIAMGIGIVTTSRAA